MKKCFVNDEDIYSIAQLELCSLDIEASCFVQCKRLLFLTGLKKQPITFDGLDSLL